MGTYRHCGVCVLVVIEETKGKKCDEQRNASKGRDGGSGGDGCRNREKTNLVLAGDLGSHPLLYIHFPMSTHHSPHPTPKISSVFATPPLLSAAAAMGLFVLILSSNYG